MGVAIIGGGLLWYLNSQSPTSTLPTTTTTASTITNTDGSTTTTNTDGTTTTTATDGTVTTTDADGTVIDTPETTTETTEGSDDSSAVDPTDCSKYRKAQHRDPKVWMNSTKTKTVGRVNYAVRKIRMRGFETHKEQYFVNDVVNWELDLGVFNTSETWCGTRAGGTLSEKCWLPPSSAGGAAGNDCCLSWAVTWTDYEERIFTDDSGIITRPAPEDDDPWSVLKGTFRIPDDAAAIGVWKCEVRYWYKDKGEVSWSGNVFRVVPEVCGQETSSAENFASDFTRSVYAPAMSRQSFMQF